jgi:Tol biopolymer transport system component
MRRTAIMLTLGVAMLAPLGAVQDPDVRLQKAMQQEITSGDLKVAIAEYRRIAEDTKAARNVRARAMLRMADAHRRLGDAEAQKIYASILANFSDQPEVVEQAKARLARENRAANVQARQARQLWVGADTSGTVSYDGSILSFTDWETGDLAIRDLASGNTRRLTRSAGWDVSGEFAEFSVPSRDGSRVAYSWFIEKPGTSYELRVIGTGLGEQKPRTLATGTAPAWIRSQAWTPDGTHLVALRVTGTEREIVLVDVSTGTMRSLRKHDGQPPHSIRISPDGRYIAYTFLTNEAPRQREIAILAIDGKTPPTIINHPADEIEVEWWPNGNGIVFVSTRTGSRALWTMEVASGRPAGPAELVATDIGRYLVGITRAGALLYAQGGARRNVSIAPLDSDGKVTGDLVRGSERFVDSTSGGVWSPDGTRLAYYALRGSNQGSGPRVIVIKTLATNEERILEPRVVVPEGNGIGLQWFPDGRSLLVVGRGRVEGVLDYYRVNADSGDTEFLFSPNTGGPGTNDPQVSPDGRSVYFVGSVAGAPRKLGRYDLATKQSSVLRDGWFPSIAISRDGRSLAYIGNFDGATNGPVHLGVIPVAGGEPMRVIDFPPTGNVRQNSLGWSQDGTHILFVRPQADGQPQSIWRVPVNGGEQSSLGVAPGGNIKRPRVHPDGRLLAFSLEQQIPTELWVLENFLSAARR